MTSHHYAEKLKDFFLKKTGIVVNKQQLTLMCNTIDERVQNHGLKDIDEYIDALESNLNYSDELKEIFNQITINESYFFRDADQMNFLEKTFFPNIIKKRRENQCKVICVWSAGCSSGQELYSIALILDKLLPDYDEWIIHLMGTDINTKVISNGIAAKYTPWGLRNVGPSMLEKYFVSNEGGFSLIETIKSRANFFYHNLSNDDYPSVVNGTSSVDVIICRNVLLYIDKKRSSEILERFSKCLTHDGILLLGVVDIMDYDTRVFDRKKHNEVVYYQKASTKVELPLVVDVPKKIKLVPKTTVKHQKPIEKKGDLLEKAQALLADEKWEELIALSSDRKELALMRVLALANIGKLDDALAECNSIQEHNKLNAETYLIQSLIYREKNNYEGAEKKLKQALFLNKDFVDAYYCLGILYFRQNKIKEGIKEFNKAIKKIDQLSEETKLYISPKMSYKKFKGLLIEEIRSYESNA